ncbi:MAG: hypothetical protein ABI589_02665 [Burkholderiales bacterium]
MKSGRQPIIWIAWPAFFSACLLEAIVFSLVDPSSLHWFGQPLALSRLGIYSAAFFVFWLITMVATALTVLLAVPGRRSLNGIGPG